MTVFFAGGDVDIGLSDRVDERIGDGASVKVRQGLADRLGAQDRGTTDIGDQDVLRDFALAKALHRHLLGQGLRGLVHRLVHLGVVDFDGQHDSVVL